MVLWGTCPGCVPSQPLVYPFPSLAGQRKELKTPCLCVSTALLQQNHWRVITTIYTKNPKRSILQVSTKTINSVPAKTMAANTQHVRGFQMFPWSSDFRALQQFSPSGSQGPKPQASFIFFAQSSWPFWVPLVGRAAACWAGLALSHNSAARSQRVTCPRIGALSRPGRRGEVEIQGYLQ